jgi:cyclopropane fatty-acyl-phospholipid synthase-like methyltransferase
MIHQVRTTIEIPAAKRDIAAEYREFAETTNDLHCLSGRGSLRDRTRAMVDAIVGRLAFSPGQKILDIGCGDAALLLAFPTASARLGTVLTAEELARLKAAPHLTGIDFATASFDDLSELPKGFDRIVVNGALHFARTEECAERAVKSIVELLATGGKIWLGELLARPAPGRPFSSRVDAIHYTFTQHGALPAMAVLAQILLRPNGVVIEPPSKLWVLKPSESAAFFKRFGLAVEGWWGCEAMTGDAFYSLQDRYSVLLSSPDN